MSAPTPIYTTKRAEDMANLNRVLLSLSIDERARILTTGYVYLSRAAGQSTATASDTITMKYAPYILAFMTQDNATFTQIPAMVITTGAALTVTEAVTLDSIVNSGGVTTVTFKAYANDTVKANADNYYIYFLVLKDKIIPTESILGS
jgi:hypothetical protein